MIVKTFIKVQSEAFKRIINRQLSLTASKLITSILDVGKPVTTVLNSTRYTEITFNRLQQNHFSNLNLFVAQIINFNSHTTTIVAYQILEFFILNLLPCQP